ncbi:MAG: elongation factor EF-2 [Nanoarchaeota archaeon]|nr:elongation factor EF-2 [Nanoarchaeota archaeon]
MVDKITRLMSKPESIRNIATVAHIDHGKTTFSDNLLAGAGMMSQELAGKQLALDFHEDEQERGITIDSANVSMVHDFEGKEFLINLIDTPGHVDFGGDVTRAMRAIDGAIVLVCAVEGMMPQTETVLRQAIRERVKPVLFINKVDRLMKELKLTPEKMQERFLNIISNVNRFIKTIAEEEYKDKWQVNVNDGSVVFGSAFHKWAMSVAFMKKKNLTFKNIIDAYENEKSEELAKVAPLHEVILDMVITHLPNPIQAQKYRVPKIWRGELEGETGKSLLSCDPKGPLAFVVVKIVYDKHAGEVAAGRLFSGTMKQGLEVWMNGLKKRVRVQQVSVYNGAKREMIDEVPSGNIVGVVGLKGVFSGETISLEEMQPFEEIKHMFEPVVTKAIEAKSPGDLPKLIEVLRQVNKEDPTIEIEINEETGEHLMHGMGELHLEVIENRIRTEKNVDVKSSPPIVVFRETVTKESPTVEGKSPNKHNKVFIRVSPIVPEMTEAIRRREIPEGRVKKKDPELWKVLENAGMDSKTSRKVREIFKGNMLIDMTRGVVHIGDVIEMIMDMFDSVMVGGPIAREPCVNVKVEILDVKLHEDAIHRGPAQFYPAVRGAIRGAMMHAKPMLYEPVQTLQFDAPEEYMGEISKTISNKRGQLLDMTTEGGQVSVKGKLPVAEMFGLSSDLRSATGGRGNHFLVDQAFERLPDELQQKIIKQIRERKGIHAEEGEAVSAR